MFPGVPSALVIVCGYAEFISVSICIAFESLGFLFWPSESLKQTAYSSLKPVVNIHNLQYIFHGKNNFSP